MKKVYLQVGNYYISFRASDSDSDSDLQKMHHLQEEKLQQQQKTLNEMTNSSEVEIKLQSKQ